MDIDNELQNPSCPKDFNCEQRKSDSSKFCTGKKGLKDGTPEYSECMKEALVSHKVLRCNLSCTVANLTDCLLKDGVCSGLSFILHPEYEEYAEDL